MHDQQSLTHHTCQSTPQLQVLAYVPVLTPPVPKQEWGILLEKWKSVCSSWKHFSYPYGLWKRLQLHPECPKINSLLAANSYIRDFMMCPCLQNLILDLAQIDNYFFDGKLLTLIWQGFYQPYVRSVLIVYVVNSS